MIKFDIKNRYTGELQFTAEIDCSDDEKKSIKLGLAVKCAIENEADLSWANLREADLSGADLRWANLREADLSWADLSGANLSEADLSWANLREADLSGANLSEANLRWANLRWANFRWANFSGADLSGADLSGANLSEADLSEADLSEVKNAPLILYGLQWPVIIEKDFMKIGCEKHLIDDWSAFEDRRILEMEGKKALKFWQQNKTMLLNLAEAHQKSYLDENTSRNSEKVVSSNEQTI